MSLHLISMAFELDRMLVLGPLAGFGQHLFILGALFCSAIFNPGDCMQVEPHRLKISRKENGAYWLLGAGACGEVLYCPVYPMMHRGCYRIRDQASSA